MTGKPEAPRQPYLNESTVVVRAPVQAWSAASGDVGEHAIDGFYFSDVRIVSSSRMRFDGQPVEAIGAVPSGADTVDFVRTLRHLHDDTADPKVRAVLRRHLTPSGVEESLTISSALAIPVTTEVTVRISGDLADVGTVNMGLRDADIPISLSGDVAHWGRDSVAVELHARDSRMRVVGTTELELAWTVTVPARGTTSIGWRFAATDSTAVVIAAATPVDWSVPRAGSADARLDRWVATALADLEALRMTTVVDPASVFIAAGAPWFLTLFGRDSIWSARFLAPLGGNLGPDTLRVLARLQGRSLDPATAEQPGKIMHELRRQKRNRPNHGLSLPPLYYGTVDATALWICLLHDSWEWGMSETRVKELLPNLEAALAWMRDYGDDDGDGLLEYIDESGLGLTNQGWKDSGDSIQWHDGTLATGPIALCEVQGYAFEAAHHGADILEHYGREASGWRAWADALRERFHERFWIDDPQGAYPAIALDAEKRAVDGVASNMGHLLGTGLLDRNQSELVARRLASPELNSGYGLRTMSTDSAGYWPLSYHGGSVWAHDTAIAIRGLTAAGFGDIATTLTDGLLAAAESFDYRMPELHSGDAATAVSRAVPYPAACHPQAWSAAAAIAVWASVTGVQPPNR